MRVPDDAPPLVSGAPAVSPRAGARGAPFGVPVNRAAAAAAGGGAPPLAAPRAAAPFGARLAPPAARPFGRTLPPPPLGLAFGGLPPPGVAYRGWRPGASAWLGE